MARLTRATIWSRSGGTLIYRSIAAADARRGRYGLKSRFFVRSIAVDEFDTVVETVASPPDWMRDGACHEHPDVDFFVDVGVSIEPARTVCQSCLVRRDCAAFALEHD